MSRLFFGFVYFTLSDVYKVKAVLNGPRQDNTLNGRFVSGCQMVRYSNGEYQTLILSGIQMNPVLRCGYCKSTLQQDSFNLVLDKRLNR